MTKSRNYLESQSLGSISNARSLSLVHVAHDGVSRMGHDGAEDSRDVAGSEGDDQLLGLAALRPWLGHHVLVEGLHGPLEAGELHHGVGDLSAPQRNQGLVEPIYSLGVLDDGEGCPESGWESSWGRGLHSDLEREKEGRKNEEAKLRTPTLTDSMGDRAMSAKNSADAEAAK